MVEFVVTLPKDNCHATIFANAKRICTGHAYVSLRLCVADLLAHGIGLDIIDYTKAVHADDDCRVINISQSKRAREIGREAAALFPSIQIIVLYFNEWSDGLELNYSIKNNR